MFNLYSFIGKKNRIIKIKNNFFRIIPNKSDGSSCFLKEILIMDIGLQGEKKQVKILAVSPKNVSRN